MLTRFPDFRESSETINSIKIANNQISVVHSRYVKTLLNLTTLSFSQMISLISLPWFPINTLPKLEFINMRSSGSHGFDCNCSMMWVTNITIKYHAISPFCFAPPHMRGKDLENIITSDFDNCTGKFYYKKN